MARAMPRAWARAMTDAITAADKLGEESAPLEDRG